jgi:acetyl-CoA carboxylase beta subunit
VDAAIAIMDFYFMGVVWDRSGRRKITQCQAATEKRFPLIFCASGAGANEGILEFDANGKDFWQVFRCHRCAANLLYIVKVLTNPTTGGVTAVLRC